MIAIKDIHPLTDFLRNNPEYRARLKASDAPIVLTVKGRPEIVLQRAEAYQAMVEEISRLKLDRVRAEVNKGFDACEDGDYSEYTDETLDELFDEIESDPGV